MKRPHLLLIMFFLWPVCVLADSFQLVKIASGLGVPWGMTFISDDKILFSERQGNLGVLNVNSGLIKYIEGLPEIHVAGQGGLMDVATPPDYGSEGWAYFTYVKPVNNYAETTLARARLNDLHLSDWQDLLVSHSVEGGDRHYGSRIAFDGEFVYFSVGDRGYRPNAQDLSTHAGSIIRLNVDGSIPIDNPFVDNNQVLDEIWSYGHRNPQGLVWDDLKQRLWSIEHGPRGGDEINLITKGKNYGWPVISYGKEYWLPLSVGEGTHKVGMEQPIKVYTPSIAPSSLLLYTGEAFPQWRGNLFSGSLKLKHINRITLNDAGQTITEERLLEGLNERIRALSQSIQGWIYLSTDQGNIYVIKPE